MSYHLEGRLLEVCDSGVLCPCWIGEIPTTAPATRCIFGEMAPTGRDHRERWGLFVRHLCAPSSAAPASRSNFTQLALRV
jgi:hypothetical protein